MQASSPATTSCARRPFLSASALAAALLAGCAAGPDFKRPAAPDVHQYTSQALPESTVSTQVVGGVAQHFVAGRNIPGDWWTLFHSPTLNALIEDSLAHNPDLAAAQAALRVAHENTLAGHGTNYPSVSASVASSREQDPPGALAPVPSNNAFLYNLFTPQLSISYVPDLFGLNRRSVESLRAQEQSTRYQMIAAYTTLTSNVVAAAIQVASLQKQIEVTQRLIDSNNEVLTILRYQLDKGYANGIDVAAQDSQLAQVKATLPPLVQQLTQQRNLLAVLSGHFPSQTPAAQFTLESLNLPDELPLSLPSTLVQQRPDVLQAQADMHAASAQIGVAAAHRLPSIELTANAGSTALAIGEVFKAGTGFWSIGANLAAPIFQGGSLMHQERAANAAYAQAVAQYRSTVLTAFQNVADTLTALQQDAASLNAAAAAADAAKTTLDLSQYQARSGYISHASLLSAEQALQEAQITLVRAQANRYLDTAALFQALGGGWWHQASLTHVDAEQTDDEK